MPETNLGPQVSVHVVTWNSMTHIASCVDSVLKQTYEPKKLFIVDNASVDGTVTWLQEHYPHLHVLRNTRNLGFCRGQNQAIRLTEAPYILVLNPDVILDAQWLQRGIAWLEKHPEYGSFSGKLLRFSYSDDELKEIMISGIIDSVGLEGDRARHFIDRGSGQQDTGQFDTPGDQFGGTGACVLLRRTAFESIRFKDEYFDEDFFAYKDDVDLAWRLQRAGWKSRYDPEARGYHHRTIQGQSVRSDVLIAKNHRSRSNFHSYYSYRNHWLMLAKNEQWSTAWRDLPWIGWYEAKKILFLLFRHPYALRAWPEVIRLWGRMRKKGRLLHHQSKTSALELRRFFVPTS